MVEILGFAPLNFGSYALSVAHQDLNNMGLNLSTINDLKLRARIEQQIADENSNRSNRASGSVFQEHQKEQPKRIHIHPKKDKGQNAVAGKRYFVSITFRVSDKRKRDAFGMLETVADCLVRAVRRFNQGDS